MGTLAQGAQHEIQKQHLEDGLECCLPIPWERNVQSSCLHYQPSIFWSSPCHGAQAVTEWLESALPPKSSAAGWLERSPGRQETWKGKVECERFLCPGLVSQLQRYCQIAPPLVLQQAKVMPIAAWKGIMEVVREQRHEGYESSSDIDVSLGP